MPTITPSEVKSVLQQSPDQQVSVLARDAAMVKSLTDVLNATVEIAEEFPQSKAELATTLTKKAVTVMGVQATASGSKELQGTHFVATQTLKTIGLMKIASLTPAKASAFITLTLAEKIVSAAGLGNFDKCNMALASLAITIGMTAFGCAVGIGCIPGAISIAADAFNVYGQCHKQ